MSHLIRQRDMSCVLVRVLCGFLVSLSEAVVLEDRPLDQFAQQTAARDFLLNATWQDTAKLESELGCQPKPYRNKEHLCFCFPSLGFRFL